MVSTTKVSPRTVAMALGSTTCPACTTRALILLIVSGRNLVRLSSIRRQSKSTSSCQSPMPMICRKLR